MVACATCQFITPETLTTTEACVKFDKDLGCSTCLRGGHHFCENRNGSAFCIEKDKLDMVRELSKQSECNHWTSDLTLTVYNKCIGRQQNQVLEKMCGNLTEIFLGGKGEKNST